LPPTFCNYHVHCHAARLEQSRKVRRTALPRIFHVVADNLIAMHSAVTRQPALRGGLGLLGSGERICNDQPEAQRDLENEECRFLCPIPECTAQAVRPNSPRTVTPRMITILRIMRDDRSRTRRRNLVPSRRTLRRRPAEQRYISPKSCLSRCLTSCRLANVLVQSRSSFARARSCALRR
jgi:hypothetical protein